VTIGTIPRNSRSASCVLTDSRRCALNTFTCILAARPSSAQSTPSPDRGGGDPDEIERQPYAIGHYGDYDNGSANQYRPRPYGYRYYQPEDLYEYRRHEFRSDGNYCYYHGCAPGNAY